MSRLLVILVVLIVVLVGGTIWLSGRATEQTPVRVEQPVSLSNLT